MNKSIRKFSSLADMKAEEYRYWQGYRRASGCDAHNVRKSKRGEFVENRGRKRD